MDTPVVAVDLALTAPSTDTLFNSIAVDKPGICETVPAGCVPIDFFPNGIDSTTD
jgi:hypothetical protein